MTKFRVDITYDSYSYDDKGIPVRDKYEANRLVDGADSVRVVSMSVISEAMSKGVKVPPWVEHKEHDIPISVYIASDAVHDTESGFTDSGFGIKYTIRQDGSVVILDGYSPLYYDWTFNTLDELVAEGYIKGDSRHIIIGTPGELGGGDLGIFDWVGFIASLEVFARFSVAGVRQVRQNAQLRNVRKIAEDWQTRGIEYPRHLREFIDTKGVWELAEVKKRLKLNDQYAIKLLTALGYEPVDDLWKMTHSTGSIKKRKAWMRNERKYMKVLEQGQ